MGDFKGLSANGNELGAMESGNNGGLQMSGVYEGGKELDTTPERGPAGGNFLQRALWHGGSVYDAWMTAVSAQVGQVILSMPTSYSQMGYRWGIIFHLLYVSLGMYTCYLLARLYVEYRTRKEREGVDFRKHFIQIFVLMSMRNVLRVSDSNAYYLNPHHDKRTWTFVFGAVSLLVIFLPTIHNYRIWSALGVLTTTYTAWYMFSASIIHGQTEGVKHTAPDVSLVTFFTGTTNILFASGGHAITIEIMHAMWKPAKYKYVYVFNGLYILSITIPHSITVYWAFGDELMKKNNAFAVLPSSNARSTAIIFMILHQAVAFGLFSAPLNFYWEKLLGVHQSHYFMRTISRLPIVCLLWLLALAFPFFGPLNSMIGSLFMSFSVLIIPSVAYIITFWTSKSHKNEAEKPNKLRKILGWWGMVTISSLVVLIIATLGTGFGGYASVVNVINQIKTFGLFQKCYQC